MAKTDPPHISQQEIDPVPQPTKAKWKSGTLACACAAGVVFILNLIIVLWAEGKTGFKPFLWKVGRRTIYGGDCDTVKKLSITVHLIINIFGTILLSASNYCMQCISAPTREEVDRVHAKGQWMEIGVPGVKNLKYISGRRVRLWALLAFSSVPLHIFYNSTVFSSLGAYAYDVFTANEAFGRNSSAPVENILGSLYYLGNSINGTELMKPVDIDKLERLSTEACLVAYAQTFQTARGNLFLVVANNTEDYTGSTPTVGFEARNEPMTVHNLDPYGWICEHSPCNSALCLDQISCLKSDMQAWKPFEKSIDYCLSEKVAQNCRLEYSIVLAVVVLFIGFLKAAVMLYIGLNFHEKPLLTVGDALASFLQRPDDFTRGACLADRNDVEMHFRRGKLADGAPKAFNNRPVRRIRAATSRRLTLFIFCFLLSAVILIFLIWFGVHGALQWGLQSVSTIWTLGLGAVSPSTLIRWTLPADGLTGIITNTAIANSPQLIFSLLYLACNGLITTMVMATEWSQFAHTRKALRVSSNPMGMQRSTYFLQVPYRIGIPLMVVSVIMHWLISQSLFLVSVNEYDLRGGGGGRYPLVGSRVLTLGYSPAAMVAALCLVIASFVAILIYGSRPLKSGMPVVGSCSAAIAAACQPGSVYKENAALEKIQWGVIEIVAEEEGEGHCGFSPDGVQVPTQGGKYK